MNYKTKHVKFTGIRDRKTTGNFEVKIDGELIHSQKKNKDGFLYENRKTFAVALKKLQDSLEGDEEPPAPAAEQAS